MQISTKVITEFRNNLRVLEREIARYLKNETDCCGVTFSQCHIILELEQQGAVSMKQLAALLELDNSTLSRVIDGMVNTGLITRQTNPDDRRAVILTLTEKGQGVAETINCQCNTFYQDVFQSLVPEKHAQVIESIALLSKALKISRQKEPLANQTTCRCQPPELSA
jgi:DNA-binding MarR family transcriptional regulator